MGFWGQLPSLKIRSILIHSGGAHGSESLVAQGVRDKTNGRKKRGNFVGKVNEKRRKRRHLFFSCQVCVNLWDFLVDGKKRGRRREKQEREM